VDAYGEEEGATEDIYACLYIDTSYLYTIGNRHIMYNVHTHTHAHIYMCMYIYIYMCIHMCTYVCIHT
jgi:hypothetical protein